MQLQKRFVMESVFALPHAKFQCNKHRWSAVNLWCMRRLTCNVPSKNLLSARNGRPCELQKKVCAENLKNRREHNILNESRPGGNWPGA